MVLNKYIRSISIISAVLAILTFCTLVLIAIVAYPGPFSPFTNYLSDLGNSALNPRGAIMFNTACGITGALTILFFAGLYKWRISGQGKLTIARAIGMFSGFALILVGVFSEDHGRLHTTVSAIFFISLTVAIIATGLALRKHVAFIRPISYYGGLVGISTLIYILSYLSGHVLIILEWVTAAGALGWMGLIAYNMLRLSSTGTKSFRKAIGIS